MKNKRLAFLLLLTGLLTNTLVMAQGNPLLKFVPADTWFFSGNTRIVNIDDYPLVSLTPSVETRLGQSEQAGLGKELAFLYELFQDLESTIQQGGQALQSHYGLSPEIAAIIYSVGSSPVIKLNLENAQALLNILDKAEKKSGLVHKLEHYEQLTYRSYALNDNFQLLINIQPQSGGYSLATIALLGNTLDDKSKRLIFGLEQPQPSIADTAKLETIARENHYLPVSISFLDFRELVRSLFQKKNNPWIAVLGDDRKLIAELQASSCEKDIMAIVQDIPQLIAGYKKYQLQGQQVKLEFEALLELKNQNVKAQLNHFRGFIPAYVHTGAAEHILAMALGGNMSQLSPFFLYITKAIKDSTFTCPALLHMQQDIAQINPAMLALVTGVVDGIHGIGFAVQDFKLVPRQLTAKSGQAAVLPRAELSMILSLSAENPLKVWQMLSAFVPALAAHKPAIIPSEQPQRLILPELNGLELDVFLALKGQHLVLFSGAQAERISQQLSNETILANGFFRESLNYSKLTSAVKALRDYMSATGNDQSLPAEACIYLDESIAMLSRVSGFVGFHSDFNSSGWLNVLNADITLQSETKTHYQLPGKYGTFFVQDGCQLARDGREEIFGNGTGLYQQYSEDGRCFIFETRYRWSRNTETVNFHYLGERSRPEGNCSNAFNNWSTPEPEYIHDICQLRSTPQGSFACLFHWDDELTKTVYKRI